MEERKKEVNRRNEERRGKKEEKEMERITLTLTQGINKRERK